MSGPDTLSVRNAHEHNLRGFDLDLPRQSLVVITGVSGSGKSSLAFDTIYQEGQRRFLESLSPYARQFLGQMERPKVDRVEGLSPTLSIDQKTVNRNPRSTVGTVTEIYDHLRLLYARLGTPRCPECLRAIARQSPGALADRLLRDAEGARLHVMAPLIRDRKGEYRKEIDDWRRDGWMRARIDGQVVELDGAVELARYEKHTIEIVVDRLVALHKDRSRLVEAIERAIRMTKGLVSVLVDTGSGPVHALHAVDRTCPEHGISIPEMEPRLFSFNAPQGACPGCGGLGYCQRSPGGTLLPAGFDTAPSARFTCPICEGRRLNRIALAVDFRGHAIDVTAGMSVLELRRFMEGLDLNAAERPLGATIVAEVRERVRFLDEVGLGYLSLDRAANTLSGGEAQRIRLAACVGSGLQGVTYVLDEPSIGLHPRDNRRLIHALGALRDAGNTVLVVEHDRETMELADYIVDIGPGAGRLGGQLTGQGPPKSFVRQDTPTARFLRDEETIPLPVRRPATGAMLRVRNARCHNLAGVDVDIPLGTLTVFTGVSGSGKSTLLFDVVETHLGHWLGEDAGRRNAALQGRYVAPDGAVILEGCDAIDKVIEISQTPIGRTPRSNPATYSGAFDLIRDLYAATPEAQARGYKKGRFSFNVPGGRCEACQGAGIRTIEMHFLADVEVGCETCGGQRFTPETLDIRWKGRSIADVLALTVGEAVEVFQHQRKLHQILQTMHAVGLDYIQLGQPGTTLSGGEAQRLKLATELHRPATGRTLYLLDEPTTGLHFQDVRVLIGALQRLVDAGNTVVVIEHHTDVIKVADHLVELGPEGGAAGGRLLFAGTPEGLARADTPTGRVLAAMTEFGGAPTRFAAGRARRHVRTEAEDIHIRGARCHNLRGVDVDIPRGKMTVITGVSGSGKTSLAFDTLFAEGQRRYVECLSTYARRFLGRLERAPVDLVTGLAPAIAIDQHNSGSTPRSTVATVTELHDYFRLLWANLGVPHCPKCGREVRALPPSAAADWLAGQDPGRGRLVADLAAPVPAAELRAEGWTRGWSGAPKGRPKGTRNVAGGHGTADDGTADNGTEIDLEDQPAIHAIVVDRLDPARVERARLAEAITNAYRLGGGVARFIAGASTRLSQRSECPDHGPVHTTGLTPRHFSFNHWLGACPGCAGVGRLWLGGSNYAPCLMCAGQRLKPEILAVTFAGRGLAAVGAYTVSEARAWFSTLALPPTDTRIAAQPLHEIRARLGFLEDVGLGYLTLDRAGDTLSGGESQRIRLASQLGGGLCGVMYVLDEPTIGLHPRDTERLLDTLEGLRQLGNTLVIVEHDPETIRRADHVIDLGPGAGEHGGLVLAAGPPDQLGPNSLTGAWLRGERFIPVPVQRRPPGAPFRLRGVTARNLRALDVDLPSGNLIAITGVSGSGKSTLVMDVLVGLLEGRTDVQGRLYRPDEAAPAVSMSEITSSAPGKRRGRTSTQKANAPVVAESPRPVRTVSAWQHAVVDQGPIGRSPRSTPATYAGVMDPLRALFAETPLARERGWTSSRFSYNTPDGACGVCGGYGHTLVEMHFLSNVWVKCEACGGRRYAPETLEARWKGYSIADILDMRADDAATLFAAHRILGRPLQALVDVGLGYLRLGQPATELSGGEAQRVKLAVGLASRTGTCLYILDEPTTGLHLQDVEKLVQVFDRLVDAGHTVVVVEHHLDVIRHADHVIELGPEAGAAGGRITAMGTPEAVMATPGSWTGIALARRAS